MILGKKIDARNMVEQTLEKLHWIEPAKPRRTP
jgi:hypothetical protein